MDGGNEVYRICPLQAISTNSLSVKQLEHWTVVPTILAPLLSDVRRFAPQWPHFQITLGMALVGALYSWSVFWTAKKFRMGSLRWRRPP